MKALFVLTLVFGLDAYSSERIECKTADHVIVIESKRSNALKVTYKREVVEADGLVEGGIIDLVAKFPSYGEVTIFARIGVVDSESYMFIQGKKISVVCR